MSAVHHAALVLSHVADPIAIPYLERTLIPGQSAWEHPLLGLGRIGTAQAVEVLHDPSCGAGPREPEVGALARWVLHRLEEEGPR